MAKRTHSSDEPVEFLMRVPSATEFVGVVRLAVSGVASRMNFSVEEIEDIKIAVSEACTNAVQYAYDRSQPHTYEVNMRVYPDQLEIIVEDKGQGFDTKILETLTPRLDSISENQGLGLGLTFIKNLMDDSEVKSKIGTGTLVRMVKRVPAPVTA